MTRVSPLHPHGTMLRAPALLLVLAAGVAQALEAKWTPNGDGPARFSKRYRDAAGIDDSRWATPDEESSWNIFPTTPMGWAMTAVACVVIFVMLGQRPTQPWQTGDRVGGDVPRAGQASEAARAAFLRKYD